jgi:hypothetical protein
VLSEQELEAIRARWLLADECESDGVCLYLKGHPCPDASYIDCDVAGWSLPQTPDAWAHGKQDVADLLAEVEALKQATEASEAERLTELLKRWVKACGVYRVATVIPYGGSLWRCDFCNAESHEGPDRVPHRPTCLVGQTERALVEPEDE